MSRAWITSSSSSLELMMVSRISVSAVVSESQAASPSDRARMTTRLRTTCGEPPPSGLPPEGFRDYDVAQREAQIGMAHLGIDHIGVVVRDLEAAVHTYRDVLGFEIGGGEELPARGLTVRFVNTGGSRIELIAPTREGSEVSGFLDKRGEGLHHICIAVDDIEAKLRELKQKGARL